MHNEFYDKYEIIKELSCSTHSKVYLVRHRILDVYRVAKIFSGNQQDARRLMKEAHLIKNLKHPHIPVIMILNRILEKIMIVSALSKNILMVNLCGNMFMTRQIPEVI